MTDWRGEIPGLKLHSHFSFSQPGSWESLPIACIRYCIVSCLWKAKDRESLQALMQTSRELRVMISSMIDAVVVQDAESMHIFPRHAIVRKLGLGRCPAKAVIWLRTFAASGPRADKRLLQIESVNLNVSLHPKEIQLCGEVKPEDITEVFDAIASLCPNMHSLAVRLSEERAINIALLQSLGKQLPHVTELCLDSVWVDILQDIGDNVDWPLHIPPNLTKLSLPSSTLPRDLIQHLVQMPTLVEVSAAGLDDDPGGRPAINTETCAWKKLR